MFNKELIDRSGFWGKIIQNEEINMIWVNCVNIV